MREQRDITIDDRGNQLKFRVTAMSALGLERWGIKAGVLLAGAGLLDLDVGEGASLDGVLSAIAGKGLSFLGKVEPEKASDLLLEMVEACAMRLNGGMQMKMTPDELDRTFDDVRSLITLQKEVFAVNFSAYSGALNAASPESPEPSDSEAPAPRRGISVRPSHR